MPQSFVSRNDLSLMRDINIFIGNGDLFQWTRSPPSHRRQGGFNYHEDKLCQSSID